MCTVTILPGAALLSTSPQPRPLLRVVFTRDELLTRRPALPPVERMCEGRRTLMPIDADAGGTWVAVNDAGLVFGLLNVNATRALGHPSAHPRKDGNATRSRGLIVPALAGCEHLPGVVERVRALDPREYGPFRLVVASATGVLDALSDGSRVRLQHQPLARPRIRTSSSLGDDRVTGPRTALFRRRLCRTAPSGAEQDAFHLHRWPDRPQLSVLMSRPDARSVSITTIEVRERRATLEYRPVIAGQHRGPAIGPASQHVLPLVPARMVGFACQPRSSGRPRAARRA